MALATITPQVVQPTGASVPAVEGNLKVAVVNIVGDTAYTAGGSPLTPQQLGLNTVLFSQASVVATTGVNATAGAASYNAATQKFQNFSVGAATAEIAAAVNVSGVTWQLICWGY